MLYLCTMKEEKYIQPFDLHNGKVKAGTIWRSRMDDANWYDAPGVGFTLPGEIVTKWEKVVPIEDLPRIKVQDLVSVFLRSGTDLSTFCSRVYPKGIILLPNE